MDSSSSSSLLSKYIFGQDSSMTNMIVIDHLVAYNHVNKHSVKHTIKQNTNKFTEQNDTYKVTNLSTLHHIYVKHQFYFISTNIHW